MTPTAIARWVTLFALFAIPFLPLLVDGALLFPYVAARGFAFRALVEIAFAGWAVLALSDPAYRPRPSPIALLFGLYVGWMAVADALAINPHKGFWGNLERMDGWVTLAHLAAFVVVADGVLGAERLWRRWWLAFVAASGLVCGYGLLQLAHLAPVSHGSPRIDALSGNPEFLAGYLLFAMAASLWLAFDPDIRRRPPSRLGLFGLAGLQAVILLASGTRGALVGLVAAMGFCVLAGAMTAGRTARRAGFVAIAGAAAGLGGLYLLRGAPFIAQSPVLARFAHIGAGDLQVRFTLWRMAWDAFLTRPVQGWGQDGFIYVFNRFYDPSLAGQEPWFDRAHNLYLDALVAGGLPALVLFLATFASAAWALARAPFTRPARIVLLGGLVAYAVQGLVVFDSLFTYLPFVALLALAHGAGRERERPAAGEPAAPWVNRIAAPAAALAALLIVWIVNGPTWRSSREIIAAVAPPGGGPLRPDELRRAIDEDGFAGVEVAEKAVKLALLMVQSPGGPQAEKMMFVTYAADQARLALAAAPHEVRLRLQLSRLYRSVGQGDDAHRELGLALADAPRHPLLLAEKAQDGAPGGP